LLATRRIFEVLKGSALYDEIDVALRQVEQIAHRPASRATLRGEAPSDGRLEDRFAYVPPVPRTYANRSEDVDELFQAVAELRVLRFRYSKEAKGTRVTSHPYALVLHGGAISCVAHDLDVGAPRVFVLDAMSELAASEAERFELPADFEISEWLHGDFGVARAARTVKLLAEFDPRSADAVRSRRIHPSQKLAVAADGRVRVSMNVPDSPELLSEVRRWLLGFGAAAHVIEPRDLAESIAHELRRAAARYGE
jgi:predicted DNA-binding transcriptional regulator YafY